MKCVSALSTDRNTEAALHDVTGRVAAGLGGEPATLAVAFVSPHHAESLGKLMKECLSRGICSHFLGVTGETIVGEGREIEAAAAVSLWAIRLPEGVSAIPVRLTWDENGCAGMPPEARAMGEAGRTLLLAGDPFSFPPDRLFKDLEVAAPGLRVVGGMASGANAAGGNRLALDGEIFESGAVGMLLDGPIAVRTVVSQGCRPVGRPMVITKAEGNIIKELGRRTAVEVLRETFTTLDEADQALIREGLHVGRVINEYQESFHQGDFLVRNVMGADTEGGIAITDLVRVGQTVQFHVRDAASADSDLHELLALDRANHPGSKVVGGLLFSCNGRGSRLFSEPDHDVNAFQEAFGPIPVAGFFAMGELGPVGGKNFVHGFTASLALFEETVNPS
ncbi:MAG: hypothetical protein JWN86_806 [Planctomycetota bacterium]|nr:hypothetical protein [Planctomycetota bacterium]